MELNDAAGLLGPSSQSTDGSHDDRVAPTHGKRKTLRRGDYASTQIFQPHAPSAIEKAFSIIIIITVFICIISTFIITIVMVITYYHQSQGAHDDGDHHHLYPHHPIITIKSKCT